MLSQKPMKIIGLWSGHDASFCVLRNGQIEHHTEAERHLRVKEPPADSIEMFYKHYGDTSDIVGLATCHLAKGIQEHDASWRRIQGLNVPLHVVGHHQAHAANAFFSCNFPEATIVTIDGGGIENEDGYCASVSFWRGVNNKIEKLRYIPIQNLNIGGIWTRCTRYVFRYESGWPQGHQAGTVMALAALGVSPGIERWLPDFQHMLTHPATLSNVTTAPPGHVKGMSAKDPKSPQHPYLKMYEDVARLDEQEKFNMAAALQQATESLIFGLVRQALSENAGSKHVCLSGGVALNSVAMGKLLKVFPDVMFYIAPVPYDGGLTIGAAQYAWHHILGNPRVEWARGHATPYLGKKYSRQEVLDALSTAGEPLDIQNAGDEYVVNLLDKGNIVSVFNGRAESGRRALGNRSILADPRSPDMKDRVNEKVKHRQWFRPFAPSVLREAVPGWFKQECDSPYMGFVLEFQDDKKALVPAVVHFDGTARLQTVTSGDNPWYYGFIKQWEQKTGIPMLLNTSFNDREPICETPQDAIKCFLGTEIDFLYFPEHRLLVHRGSTP